jgi:predicted tellurium resistance membrane protein TerC
MNDLLQLAGEPAAWAALAALIAMEVVLGIDNLIFISILTNKLPVEHRSRVRRIGIGGALVLRLALLGTVAFIVTLTQPIFAAFGHGFSWRDLILIAGGLFLVWKATKEIHQKLDPEPGALFSTPASKALGAAAVIGQVLVLDLVFSIDSIITAVGMTDELAIMVIAVLVAVTLMLCAADPLGRFIEANPSVVMLALAFLLMIGMTLIAEGFGAHIPKGYIYVAMAFSAGVETLNLLSRKAAKGSSKQPIRKAARSSGREPG